MHYSARMAFHKSSDTSQSQHFDIMVPEEAFQYPETLQKYMITESEFFKQNPQYNKLCCGAVIFDTEGKMLLVQRAKTEKAFPDFWVCDGMQQHTHGADSPISSGNPWGQGRRHG